LIKSSKQCKGDSTPVLNSAPRYEDMLGRRWSYNLHAFCGIYSRALNVKNLRNL